MHDRFPRSVAIAFQHRGHDDILMPYENEARDEVGAGCRNRTRDIQFTKLALYQLS